MRYREEAFTFDCRGDSLVGVLAMPEQPAGDTGVLVVVGGPQYRVGSHRQFVELSRALAVTGIPCLRFDYRGMGDSEGEARDFARISEDIRAAVDTFFNCIPYATDVVLWGLCDGATASAFYAPTDNRVTGLVLLNPWIHTERAEAKAYLKHYYFRRITSAAFWRKLVSDDFDLRHALSEATQLFRRALSSASSGDNRSPDDLPLPQQVYDSLTQRIVPTLILLSGRDFVAREFEGLIAGDANWSRYIETVRVDRLKSADHTFSDPADSDWATQMTIDWINSL